MRTARNILPLLVMMPLLCSLCGAAGHPKAPSKISGRGMYVCATPVSAYQFWQDVKSAQGMGAKLTADDFERIARKQSEKTGQPACFWLGSRRELKPVFADAGGMMVVSDGKIKGWVTPQYYVDYINSAPPK